jgi:hypothetical protein
LFIAVAMIEKNGIEGGDAVQEQSRIGYIVRGYVPDGTFEGSPAFQRRVSRLLRFASRRDA